MTIVRKPSKNQQINEQLVEWIKELYEEQNGILGYRQMTIIINREHNTLYNKKRICRLMQILHLQSVFRKKKHKINLHKLLKTTNISTILSDTN